MEVFAMETLVIKIKIKMLLFSAMLKKIHIIHTTYFINNSCKNDFLSKIERTLCKLHIIK